VKLTKLLSIVLIMSVILSVTAGCSKSAASTTTTTTEAFVVPGNFTTYTDETSLFRISYPNQWEPMSQSDLSAYGSDVKDALSNLKAGLPVDKANIIFLAGLRISTGYYPSVNIVVEPAPVMVTDNDMAMQAEVTGIKQEVTNYQEVSRTKMMVNGESTTILEYKAIFPGSSTLMHNYYLAFLSGKTIWSVTCSATDTDYSQLSGDFDNIFRSFQLTN
jgi:PsbP-like protein